jgi:Flp pilus assembly protein TadG
VEFALLFPIFMVLAMGTIAAGTAFSKQINITQAAREASRFGGTYDITVAGDIDTWLQRVTTATQEAAGDADAPLGGYDYVCVAFVTTDATGNPDTTLSRYSENGGAAQDGACPGGTDQANVPDTDYVQVAISRGTTFNAIFISPTLQLDAVSFTPYEAEAPESL